MKFKQNQILSLSTLLCGGMLLFLTGTAWGQTTTNLIPEDKIEEGALETP